MAGNGTFFLVVNLAHLHSEKSFVWYDVIGGPKCRCKCPVLSHLRSSFNPKNSC